MNIPFLVCVRCYTFNHVNYIKDALDGFCMQKTEFPFVCCVVDDASTDGEQEVIKEYLQNHFDLKDESIVRNEETEDYNLVFSKHKENEMCYIAVLFLKYNHYSIKKPKMPYIEEWQKTAKYEASCEGDDFWIDPTKLQKQADALETHPECTIAFCKVKNVSRKGTDLKSTKPDGDYIKPGIVFLDEFLKYQYGHCKWVFQTSGYFYRLNLIEECSKTLFYKTHPVGDEPMAIEFLLRGNGYYIDDICSCYRVQSGGHTSVTKSSPELGIAFQKRIIEAVSILDTYTNNKYHDYIEIRKSNAYFLIDFYQKNYMNLFNHKYWRLYHILSKKMFLIMLIRVLCPPLYKKLRESRISR